MLPPFSTASVKNARLSYIDMLRGIAVLMVICRHWPPGSHLGNLGWLGVDLFFVISGFLISNLLFSELEKAGTIDLTRFFLRRGLKIYPLFFLLILVTWLVNYFGGYDPATRPYLHELLFIQNYFGGVYLHTWSLAVEEHFYIILLLCFAFFTKRRTMLPYLFALLVVLPLVFRAWRVMSGDANNHFATHTRIDSLFIGVLLCYGWRYHRDRFSISRTKKNFLLIACSAYVLSYAFVMPESGYVQSIGFTLIALAFAGILSCALTTKGPGNAFSRPLSFIGYYSYPVYLLHIPVKWILEYFGMEEQTGAINIVYFFIYAFLCVAAGVAFSEMIEQPILRWRDRKIPSRA